MKLLLLNTLMLFLLFACNENIEIVTENIIDNFEEYKVLEEESINLEKIDIGTKLNNPWALEFINDNKAKSVGLGYEECNNIMNHDPSAFNWNYAKYPKDLAEQILKYFYTTKEELDYDNIGVEYG